MDGIKHRLYDTINMSDGGLENGGSTRGGSSSSTGGKSPGIQQIQLFRYSKYIFFLK